MNIDDVHTTTDMLVVIGKAVETDNWVLFDRCRNKVNDWLIPEYEKQAWNQFFESIESKLDL